MDVSLEQCCAIKFCVCLKKTPSETTTLLKEAFRREVLGDLTIWWWHKAFIDGRESQNSNTGCELQIVVTATNINTVVTVIEED